jgi:hypothetical protein
METQRRYRGVHRPAPRPRYSIHPASRHRIARAELGYRQKILGAILQSQQMQERTEPSPQEELTASDEESDDNNPIK